MLRKLSAFILISATVGAVANAQQTPTAPQEPVEKRIQRMVLTAPFQRSYMGVQTQEITKENFSKFGLSTVRGVGIEKVIENSPAAQAGLQVNDVIVRFEGEEVASVLKLTRLISEVAPDHTAKVTVLRGGTEREINVTLGKSDVPQFQTGGVLEKWYGLPGIPEFPRVPRVRELPLTADGNESNVFIYRTGANRQIGIGTAPLTKQLGDYFGVAEGRGLLINNVRENSPAAKAGLKAGDVIVEIEGKEVKGTPDLIRSLNENKGGDVSLTIVRDRNRQIVRVTPEISKDGAMNFEEFEKFFEPNSNQMQFRMQTPQTAPLPEARIKIAPRIL
ncbi:MAG: PDZ domain-containing protein [Acidobacteria bacterium]|jgi:serine protease Do|nr:PDZ domain-containing protein [Acidobacteriota bacterium]